MLGSGHGFRSILVLIKNEADEALAQDLDTWNETWPQSNQIPHVHMGSPWGEDAQQCTLVAARAVSCSQIVVFIQENWSATVLRNIN